MSGILTSLAGILPTAGGAWTPNSEASLVNWYDASTSGYSNGASVTTFVDSKTGNPNPLTSTGGFNPTCATAAQNGLRTFAFNGSQCLETGGSSAHTLPYTIAMVLKIPNLSSQYRFLASEISITSGGIDFFNYTDGTLGINQAGVAVVSQSTGTLGTAAYHLVVVQQSSTAYAYFIDGVAAGSGSGSFSLLGTGTFVIGARLFNASPNSALTGNIGECQIYNSIIDATARANLLAYIQGKWATP